MLNIMLANVSFASSVSIVRPADNITVRVGYTQTIMVNEPAEILINGAAVGVATLNTTIRRDDVTGTAGSPNTLLPYYIFSHTFDTTGTFEITAQSGGDTDTVTVVVVPVTENLIVDMNFANYTATFDNPEPPSIANLAWSNFASVRMFAAQDVGGRTGTSLAIAPRAAGYNEAIMTYGTPFFGKVTFEMSVRPAVRSGNVLMRLGDRTGGAFMWNALVLHENGWITAALGNRATQNTFLRQYDAGEWLDFRVEADFENRWIDLYINNVKYLSQAPLTGDWIVFGDPVAEQVNFSALRTNWFQITAPAANVPNTQLYVGSHRIIQHQEAPRVRSVEYDGNRINITFTASFTGDMRDANGAIAQSRLFMLVDGERLPVPVTPEFNAATRVYSLTPAFPLEYFCEYEIEFPGSFGTGTNFIGPGVFSFKTEPAPVNLDSAVIAGSNVDVTVSNRSGNSVTAAIVVATYNNGVMNTIVYRPVTVADESSITESIPVTVAAGDSVVVYLMSSLEVFNPLSLEVRL